jgi:hypothetical protein
MRTNKSVNYSSIKKRKLRDLYTKPEVIKEVKK